MCENPYKLEKEAIAKLIEQIESSGVFSEDGDWVGVKDMPLAYRNAPNFKWCLSVCNYYPEGHPDKDIHFSIISRADDEAKDRFGGRLVISLPFKDRDKPEFLEVFLTTIKFWELDG